MSAARGLALFLLLSGHAFFLGLGLAALGVFCGRRWRILSGTLLWLGLGVAFSSALPVHPAANVVLLVAALAWRLTLSGNHALRRSMAAVLLAVVATLVATELLARRVSMPTIALDRLVVIGDSLSAGIRASQEETWPLLLGTRYNLRVTNLARPGATLASARAQVDAVPEGPIAVLVELGGNDLLSGTSNARFASDLRLLFAALDTKERLVLMFELPLLPTQTSYGRIQRRVCRELGVLLVPRSILAGAVALPGHTIDGLHLSPAGHSWLAARVGTWLWAQRGRSSATRPTAMGLSADEASDPRLRRSGGHLLAFCSIRRLGSRTLAFARRTRPAAAASPWPIACQNARECVSRQGEEGFALPPTVFSRAGSRPS